MKHKRKIITGIIFFALFVTTHSYLHAQNIDGDTGLVDKMAALVFQLGVILFAAWGGGKVFEKFGLPHVLGEVVAGMIIGPFLLGGLPVPGFPEGLFPLMSGDFPISIELYSFTAIASIILLFLVGLETDIETFLSYSVAGTAVGIGGALVSFVVGDLVTVWLSNNVFGSEYGFAHPVPLFLGIVSTATSVGISARILSDKQKMGSPEGVTILSAAVIDDVIGIILLAIVIGVAKRGNIAWHHIAVISAKSIGLWMGFTIIGLVAARYVSTLLKTFRDTTTIAVMSLALALLLSGVFEKSGLAMIIGAYVMGLSLSKTDLSFIIQDKMTVLRRFFIPIFFCVMGMFVNFRGIFVPGLMFFGIVYLLSSFVSKLAGCGFPAMLFNFNLRGAMRIGMGMVPRGEVALIIAGIGLSAGIIPREIFSVAVIMAFITTLVTPPVLERLLSDKRTVLRKETETRTEHKEIVYEMPNPETAELLLSKVVSNFESEGFFVQLMELSASVYQIRKNDMFITLKYTPEKLSFDCLEEYEPFIHTLFYEVLADFENLMKNMKALEDKANIGKKIFERENGAKCRRKIRVPHSISPLAIEIDIKGTTKHEILEELTDLLLRSGQINTKKRKTVLEDIIKRETDMSTGMQEGIAFPHAKTRAVDHLVSAIGISKEGVDFDSLDNKKTFIFIVTLAPKDSAESYLQYMSEISTFLMEKDNRESIMNCKSNRDLYDVLTGCNGCFQEK